MVDGFHESLKRDGRESPFAGRLFSGQAIVNKTAFTWSVLVGLSFWSAFAYTQGSVGFAEVKPDVVIRVRKAPSGADYVHVQAVDANYPPKLLEEQCRKVGKFIGSGIRGLRVWYSSLGKLPSGPEVRVLRADFAVDFVINQESGVLRLVPFAKAFAGAPEPHRVECLAIAFEGVTPREGVTVKEVDNSSVRLWGSYDKQMNVVEYRIILKTQKPGEVDFPEVVTPMRTNRPENPSTHRRDWRMLVLTSTGAVLVGVLVYLALRPYRGKSSAPR